MRQYFFIFAGVMVIVFFVGYFLYMIARAFFRLYDDYHLGKELDELEGEAEQRRVKKAELAAERLDNGCDHDFDTEFGTFPPDVCRKCGITKEKPRSGCDHVWVKQDGPVPASMCEKCGKDYRSTSITEGSLNE